MFGLWPRELTPRDLLTAMNRLRMFICAGVAIYAIIYKVDIIQSVIIK